MTDIVITRKERKPEGVFSVMSNDMVALEHSYPTEDGGWEPKIPNGTYRCVRGKHRLHGMDKDFETFEITGVEGHTGLLFHWGNYNRDSEGCVLVGASEDGVMITMSRASFAKFMTLQDGVDEFQLTVGG